MTECCCNCGCDQPATDNRCAFCMRYHDWWDAGSEVYVGFLDMPESVAA